MPLKSDWKLSENDGRAATTLIVEEIARRRISRRHLADLAKISLSTLEKVLSGRRPFTLATMVRLEEALGRPLRQTNGAAHPVVSSTPGLAPDELGNYSRPSVQWLEGAYVTIRRSFGNAKAVYAYRTEITWDDQASILAFREAERTDAAFTQFGQVSIPNQSGYIYLVTNRHGQYRMIIMARPTISGEMHGILTTLKVGRGAQLTPIATAIVMVPIKGLRDVQFGQIGPSEAAFRSYETLLKRTIDEQFALLLGD